ncbi:MAG TPA: MerR family transcriptional regulator [Candidatus Bathyarchaeia archaeon]|nr:MerR family transcriptional regulator [Candidatus Bathyarchaeia archaeon]
MKTKWFSIGKASRYLSISRDTLRRWEKTKEIKPFRSPTNRRFYTEKQLVNLMKVGKSRKKRFIKGKLGSSKTKRLTKIIQFILITTLTFGSGVLIALLIIYFFFS